MRRMISWGSSASLAARPGLGAAPRTTATSRNQRVQYGDIHLLHFVATIVHHTPVALMPPEKDENGCNSRVYNEVKYTHSWLCRQVRETLAHLVPTPCHAAGVSPIIGAGRGLGLLLGLLVPAGLPSHPHGSTYRGPDGRSLPSITANGAANGPEGGAAAGAA